MFSLALCDDGLPDVIKHKVTRCSERYSASSTEEKHFYPAWVPRAPNDTVKLSDVSQLEASFLHQSASEVNGLPYWGYLTIYGANGYLANLGDSSESAFKLVQELQENKWVDELTRAVFIEFSVLNMNTGLFSEITIVFEFPSYGSTFTWQSINSVLLYRYTGAVGLMVLILELLVVVYFIYVLVREIKQVIKLGKEYMLQVVSWIHMTIIVLFIIFTSCYIQRSMLTSRTVEEMMNNKGILFHI